MKLDILRSVLERLSRNRTFRRSLVVNGVGYPIVVSPDAQLKYLKLNPNAFDSDLVQLACRFVQEGSDVWDIGANVGTFSVAAMACSRTGDVIAFEPDVFLVNMLRRTARLQPGNPDRIKVVPVAVSMTDGVERFAIAARGRASNALDYNGESGEVFIHFRSSGLNSFILQPR